MTSQEKKLITDFNFGVLSKEEFLKKYPVDVVNDKDYILLSIAEANNKKSAEDLEFALFLILFNNDVIYRTGFDELICKLLKEDWHYKHEELVLILQKLRSPKCVDTLYEIVFKKFDYLSYDDTYSLGRKCIHALGDINNDEAKKKLELLSKSNVPILREKAEKQLLYYKH